MRSAMETGFSRLFFSFNIHLIKEQYQNRGTNVTPEKEITFFVT
jgi:hypothetical protein